MTSISTEDDENALQAASAVTTGYATPTVNTAFTRRSVHLRS